MNHSMAKRIAPTAPVQIRPYLLRAAHLRMLVSAVELAQVAMDEPAVVTAGERFFRRQVADRTELERLLAEQDAHSHFFPWLLWDADLPDGPLGMRLLERRLPAVEREVLLALLAAPADVFQVVGASAQATVLERVADGRCVAVTEPVLRAVATRGEMYVARVLDCGDCCLLDAVHACLPATARRSLVRAARRVRDMTPDGGLPVLLTAVQRASQRAQLPAMPWQHGDQLLHGTLVFAVDDASALDAALESACQRGALTLRPDRRFAISDESFGPPGAVLRRSGGRLYAATSWQRANDLRQAVQAALPGVRYVSTLVRDLDTLLDPETRIHWQNDELQTVARDWIGECLATFHETAHPWLGGVTPREAIRTPAGRTQVHAWLRTVEQVSEVAGPGWEKALQSIWRDLSGT